MSLTILASALGGLVALAIALIRLERWIANRYRKQGRSQVLESLSHTFISDVATNHLPHIFDALKLIAEKIGVELPDPPPIRYLPYDPTEKK